PTSTPTTPAKAKQLLKDAAKAGKDILETAKALEPGILETLVAVPVIEATLFRIMEHLVGLRRLFKFFLSLRVVGIAVRVVLERQLAIAFFDLIFCGSACDAEDLVIVPFSHSIVSPSGRLITQYTTSSRPPCVLSLVATGVVIVV